MYVHKVWLAMHEENGTTSTCRRGHSKFDTVPLEIILRKKETSSGLQSTEPRPDHVEPIHVHYVLSNLTLMAEHLGTP